MIPFPLPTPYFCPVSLFEMEIKDNYPVNFTQEHIPKFVDFTMTDD